MPYGLTDFARRADLVLCAVLARQTILATGLELARNRARSSGILIDLAQQWCALCGSLHTQRHRGHSEMQETV